MNGRNHHQHQLNFPLTKTQKEYSKESRTNKLGSYKNTLQETLFILRDFPLTAKQEEYSKESRTGKLGSYKNTLQETLFILRDFPRYSTVKTETK